MTGFAAFSPPPLHPAIVELAGRAQWVAWALVERDGRFTKPPISARTGAGASHSRPADWTTFDQAVAFASSQRMAGVGFVTTDEDGVTGVDLDKCRDPETGDIEPWAREIVDLAETYAEVSPSGRGIRMFWRGKIGETVKADAAHVEIYRSKRYLTVTGRHIEGTPTDIRPAPLTEAALLERVRRVKGGKASPCAVGSQLRENEDGTAIDLETGECFDSLEEAERARTSPAAAPVQRTAPARPAGDDFFRTVNSRALAALPAWVPSIFPTARFQSGTGGYRVTSRDLGRDLEEDLSFVADGITDWGVADMGDARQGRRSAIDIVMEYGVAGDVVSAALWLCDRLGADPTSIGWQEATTVDAEAAAIGAQAVAGMVRKVVNTASDGTEADRYREEEDGTLVDVETGEVVSEGRSEGRIEDPRDFPEDELRDLPGVVGDIVEWICDWTAEPIRIHALGAALTIVGTLVSRKVFTLTRPCGTSLYVGAIAPSGLGKQHPQDCIRMALDSVLSGEGHCIGWQKSATKLAQALLNRGARLMLVDEFTGKLNGIRGRAAMSHETAIVETLLQLWGTNTGDFQPDASIANGGDVKLKRPGLSLYGASPTRQFSESLASKDVTNGLFNRFLLLPRYAPVATTADPEGIMALPQNLAEKLQALHACLPPEQMLFECAGDIAPGSPHLVPFDPAAHEVNEENKRYEKAMMIRADKDAVYSLYGRYAEQIKRIALVFACGRHWDDLSSATICVDDMAFAGRVVAWSIGEFRAMVDRDMTENVSQQQYKLVLSIVRDAKALTRNQLTRKVHGRMPKRELDAIVSSLAEAQEIEIEPYKTKGRPGQILRRKV